MDQSLYRKDKDASPLPEDSQGDLETALAASKEVLSHLNHEIETLTTTVESLRKERDVLKDRVRSLSKALAAARPLSESPSNNGKAEKTPPTEEMKAAFFEKVPEWHIIRDISSLQGWLIHPEEVVLGELLGQGSYGTVHRGTWRGAEIAVKCCKIDSEEHAEMFAREIYSLSLLRHPHVVNLYGMCLPYLRNSQDEALECWILFEIMPGGSLSQWYKTARHSFIDRLRKLLDVARGMQALEQHSPPILHRDLKPSNVLLDHHGVPKIADFGLSRALLEAENHHTVLTGETGSYLYMSPECIRHEFYSISSDVWSFGILALEILTGSKPYADRHMLPVQLALAVGDGQIVPHVPSDFPEKLRHVISACFEYDPVNRPSFGILQIILAGTLDELSEERARQGSISRWFWR